MEKDRQIPDVPGLEEKSWDAAGTGSAGLHAALMGAGGWFQDQDIHLKKIQKDKLPTLTMAGLS